MLVLYVHEYAVLMSFNFFEIFVIIIFANYLTNRKILKFLYMMDIIHKQPNEYIYNSLFFKELMTASQFSLNTSLITPKTVFPNNKLQNF